MTTVEKVVTWRVIDVDEERLNAYSDLAIGEAIGGDLGAAMVAAAQHNLAALADPERGDSGQPETHEGEPE